MFDCLFFCYLLDTVKEFCRPTKRDRADARAESFHYRKRAYVTVECIELFYLSRLPTAHFTLAPFVRIRHRMFICARLHEKKKHTTRKCIKIATEAKLVVAIALAKAFASPFLLQIKMVFFSNLLHTKRGFFEAALPRCDVHFCMVRFSQQKKTSEKRKHNSWVDEANGKTLFGGRILNEFAKLYPQMHDRVIYYASHFLLRIFRQTQASFHILRLRNFYSSLCMLCKRAAFGYGFAQKIWTLFSCQNSFREREARGAREKIRRGTAGMLFLMPLTVRFQCSARTLSLSLCSEFMRIPLWWSHFNRHGFHIKYWKLMNT